MKNLLWAACVALLISCQAAPKPADTAQSDTSYAFGALIGNSLKSTSVAIDYEAFLNGVKDSLDKNAPKITLEKANEIVQAAIVEATKKKGEDNLAAESKYLAENGKKAGVTTTSSGLQYEILTQGTGSKPKANSTVKVDYEGKLLDGTVFDSSIARGQPATFSVDGVIPGWTEILQLMSVGSKFKVTIPSALAYGPNGSGSRIAPNSTLVFEMTLIAIEK